VICFYSTCTKQADDQVETRPMCAEHALAFKAALGTIQADIRNRNQRRVLTERKVPNRDAHAVARVARASRPRTPIYKAYGTELLAGAWELGKNGRH